MSNGCPCGNKRDRQTQDELRQRQQARSRIEAMEILMGCGLTRSEALEQLREQEPLTEELRSCGV